MPGFGFGAGFRTNSVGRRGRRVGAGPGAGSFGVLEPGPGWTGVAASGFATIPVDPPRTTAKPVARFVTPPDIYFLDEEIVGVAAYANVGGTLIGGIDRVRFHFEGNTLDVVEPKLREFTRHDGSTYAVLGYWVRLKKPQNASGQAQLFAEAIPANANMQRRVLGPVNYFPVVPFAQTGTVHDAAIEVRPSQPQITGARYKTVGAAISYCRAQNLKNPLVTIMETIVNEDIDNTTSASSVYAFPGYCHVRTAPGVTASYAKPSFSGDVNSNIRLLMNGIHFEGDQTFDLQHIQTIYLEFTLAKGHWFDRIRITNSGGSGAMWRKGIRPFKPVLREVSWMTDCLVDNMRDGLVDMQLARGCILENSIGDIGTSTRALIGCVVRNHFNSANWNHDIDALRITAPAGATIAIAGGVDSTGRIFTLKVNGTSVGTFTVGSNEARYNTANAPGYNAATAGQGYHVADVAAWINSLPGWSATVLDNTRRASTLCLPNTKGQGFSDTPVNGSRTLVTVFDIHADYYQQSGVAENILMDGNIGYEVEAAMFLLGDTLAGGTRDYVIINNALMNSTVSAQYYNPLAGASQFGGQPQSHIVFAHNTIPYQEVWLRTAGGFNPDTYCLVANNALFDLRWIDNPDPDLTIRDNVIDAGNVAPALATGTTIAGDYLSKFGSATTGDFTPVGALLANRKPPTLAFDLYGNARGPLAPAGAVS